MDRRSRRSRSSGRITCASMRTRAPPSFGFSSRCWSAAMISRRTAALLGRGGRALALDRSRPVRGQPPTTELPLWSFIAGIRMFRLWVMGRLGRELEKARILTGPSPRSGGRQPGELVHDGAAHLGGPDLAHVGLHDVAGAVAPASAPAIASSSRSASSPCRRSSAAPCRSWRWRRSGWRGPCRRCRAPSRAPARRARGACRSRVGRAERGRRQHAERARQHRRLVGQHVAE